MKKDNISFRLISVLSLALASCGGNRNNDDKDTTKDTEKTPSTESSSDTGMLDPEDGKVTSDTESDTNSLIGDIESGIESGIDGIESGVRGMMGR